MVMKVEREAVPAVLLILSAPGSDAASDGCSKLGLTQVSKPVEVEQVVMAQRSGKGE